MRASSDGTATPVTVVEQMRSTSSGSSPASSSAPDTRRTPEFHRVFDEQVVRLAEVGQCRVLLDRQDEVATVDLCARVQATDDVFESGERRNLDEGVGDLIPGCTGAAVVRRAHLR